MQPLDMHYNTNYYLDIESFMYTKKKKKNERRRSSWVSLVEFQFHLPFEVIKPLCGQWQQLVPSFTAHAQRTCICILCWNHVIYRFCLGTVNCVFWSVSQCRSSCERNANIQNCYITQNATHTNTHTHMYTLVSGYVMLYLHDSFLTS